MFEATHPTLLLDHLRIPVREIGHEPGARDGWVRLRWRGRAAATALVTWPRRSADRGRVAEYRLGATPIFGQLAAEEDVRAELARQGTGWRPRTPVVDRAGRRVGAVWQDATGSVLLPFDPDELIRNYWTERYQLAVGSPLRRHARMLARWVYYRLRPVVPRGAQIALRRLYVPLQARASFPRWPAEPAADELCTWLLQLLADAAGEPLPRLAAWPRGCGWCVALTHDVETAVGVARMGPLRAMEEAVGLRSAWYLVPRRYAVPDELVASLSGDGFEIGVHGLHHDGRDLESRAMLEERLPEIRAYAARWGAVGFRGPALNRDWDLMPLLGFDYDTSYPETDPHGPQAAGCCSWLPFFNRDLVELPVTLPQDHTVFDILGQRDERLWVEKAALLRDRGGLAMSIVHPDYMATAPRLAAYGRLLERLAGDASAWCALPREVAAWWRRRAASRVELVHGAWRVVGPAADAATIELTALTPGGRVSAA